MSEANAASNFTAIFYEDPGHGWLKVSKAELDQLGIEHRISSGSYMSADRAYAYLEEDCDLDVYMKARGFTSLEQLNCKRIHEEDSHVRHLLPYWPV